MRVVFLKSQINNRGGLEKYTLRLADAFARQGAEVVLLTTGWEPSQGTPKSIACINVASSHSLSFLHLLQFDHACRRYLQHHPADIIFGMDRNSHQTHYRAGNGVHAAFLKRRAKTEPWYKATTFNINPLHRTILRLEKTAFEDPELKILFTNSHLVRQEINEFYNTDHRKIQVVHNGVEWFEMQSAFDSWQKTQPELKRALNRNPSAFQLLFAGHNFHRKGLHFLLEGMRRLGRRDLQLSIVGKDKEQTLWLEKVHNLGLSDQVTFFGPQPTLKPFYQMADAIAVPSIYDPFANVTVEGLAMGLYVVTSMFNGAHEIITPETGTKIMDLTDPASVAASLNLAMTHRKTLENSEKIRASVKALDFSSQLEKIVSATLASSHVTS